MYTMKLKGVEVKSTNKDLIDRLEEIRVGLEELEKLDEKIEEKFVSIIKTTIW